MEEKQKDTEVTEQPSPETPSVSPASEVPIAEQPHPLVSPETAVINGKPVVVSSIPNVEANQQAVNQKPSKWRYFFWVIGILQILGIIIFFLTMFSLVGVTGGEFIALLLFLTLVPAIGLIALINLIGLPIYMRRHKPRGKRLALCIISLSVSVLLAMFGAWSVYQMRVAVPKHLNELDKQSTRRFTQEQQEFEADNAKPEISEAEAIQLLQSCKLKGFYYTNQTDKTDPANGGWGELSPTGVVLTKVDGEPYRISIADRLIPELVPIARAAQKTCGGPQFWHDGNYEQFKEGKWYFNGQVVNDTQSGNTKEEAISLMQSCKVDYFVGYKGDVNVVKDQSSRQWLQKAEASTNGIEISQNAPKTYIFTSKAQTAALQDVARQYRQSCYSTKKLYIAIDDWIETEYPAGQWTRVKQ